MPNVKKLPLIIAAIFWMLSLTLSTYSFADNENPVAPAKQADEKPNWIKIIDYNYSSKRSLSSYQDGLYLFSPNEVYRIDNNGKNWQKMGDAALEDRVLTGGFVAYKGYLYVGTYGGLFRVKIGKKKWNMVPGLMSHETVDVLYAHKDNLYVGSSSGEVYKSKNGKNNWQSVGNSIGHQIQALYVSDDNYIYAGTDKGLFRIKDGGYRWEEAIYGKGIYAITEFNGYLYAGMHGGYTSSESMERKRGHRDLTNAVYRSKIGEGWSWERMGGETLFGFEGNTLCTYDGYLYLGTNGGLFRTQDGKNWLQPKGELDHESIKNLHVHDGYLFISSVIGDIYRTTEKVAQEPSIGSYIYEEDVIVIEDDGDPEEPIIYPDTSPACELCICYPSNKNGEFDNFLEQMQHSQHIKGYLTKNKCKRACEKRDMLFGMCTREPQLVGGF